MRFESKPKLKTIQLTLREDEIQLLDNIAKARNTSRQKILRGILRGGTENPLPGFFDKIIGAEVEGLNRGAERGTR